MNVLCSFYYHHQWTRLFVYGELALLLMNASEFSLIRVLVSFLSLSSVVFLLFLVMFVSFNSLSFFLQ